MSNKTAFLFDDPLGLNSGSSSSQSNDDFVMPSQETVGEFRTLDSSKINLKAKKEPKSDNKTAVASNSSNFVVKDDMWGSNGQMKSSIIVDSDKLFDDPFASSSATSTTKASTEADIFGNDDKASKMVNSHLDLFGDVTVASATNKKTTPSQAALSSRSVGREANFGTQQKDDQFNDLKLDVAKEDDLDFETFGKSKTVEVKKDEKKKNTKILDELYDEDMDLKKSFNQLKSLESATVEKKTSPIVVSSKQKAAPEVSAEIDFDMANLDLDSYINENSKDKGGLFD